MESAREVALGGLIAYRRKGSWPDLYLKQEGEKNRLSAQDSAFAAALMYGTLQNRSLIDHYISEYSSMPLNKITPQVLDAIRLGVFQLLFMDKVPKSAAVNEMVNIVKRTGNSRAAGFTNAVLRKLADCTELPPVDKSDFTNYLAVKYSHAFWFAGKMRKKLGDEQAEMLLMANNKEPEITIRANLLKITADKLVSELTQLGYAASAHKSIDGCIYLDKLRGIFDTVQFKAGYFYVQDIASQLAVQALSPKAGNTVIDMCAAPGGKSLLAAQMMENEGKIISMDIHPHKVDIIEENARVFGIDIIQAAAVDASKCIERLKLSADKIICDVPCSGMGIIRKKPDIRYKEYEQLYTLPQIQYEILCTAAEYLKVDGELVYSTCTVLTEENERVVERFLSEHRGYELTPFELSEKGSVERGMLTLYPHIDGTDGFFMAKIKKI